MTPEDHRAVVEARFEVGTFEPLGDGWVCFTYELNGEWIVQFPRFPIAEATTRKQLALLPELAKELPAEIPVPELVSHDPLCIAYPKIEGEPLDADAALASDVPERLGRFLHALHSVAPELVGWRPIGTDVFREICRGELRELRERVFPLLDAAERDRADAMFSAFVDDDDTFRFVTTIAHRDLGPEHVLVHGGELVGVIDWGDVAIGDPAIDLWWIAGHTGFGERVLAAYGGTPDRTFRDRAAFWFRLGPWHEVTYGLDTGRSAFVRSGLEGVRTRLP